ncbi:signal peptide [Bradyrhizobium oligotrophicum S58]|uniref:Lectin-like protein BA14k n=1 Tax=Bradyrhizobium oligotrophicum S58 TaxID=1245469 RepID=M4Z5P4_9BRAD|nr:BA14K family protein [Bradyrhizobium oligotrophicum]BAM88818.1 signal peptide [Bradyrhizobium oligotrophicum S58]
MDLRKFLTVATIGTMTLAAASPLAAAPLQTKQAAPMAATQNATELQQVQYRYGRGGYGHRHGHYGHYGHRHGYGPGAAALGGLAAGAIIGGAIANSRAEAANAQAYCAQRFRSYDPGSGTYLANDGMRRSCP